MGTLPGEATWDPVHLMDFFYHFFQMCVCVYIYVCVNTYICVCVYIYVCVCTYICVCIYMCVCVYIYVYIYTHIYIYVCMYLFIYLAEEGLLQGQTRRMVGLCSKSMDFDRCLSPLLPGHLVRTPVYGGLWMQA